MTSSRKPREISVLEFKLLEIEKYDRRQKATCLVLSMDPDHENTLREFLVEVIELDPDKINIQELYKAVKNELNIYVDCNGDTSSREDLWDAVCFSLTGMNYPSYNSSQNYKDTFESLIRPYCLDAELLGSNTEPECMNFKQN